MPTVEAYADLASRLLDLPRSAGATRVVAIDGRAGAGKTTFATRLGAALDAARTSWTVVHTDDLSTHADFFGWWPTLVAGVLEPLRDRKPGSHPVYDWVQRRVTAQRVIPVTEVLLVDGVGSGRRELAGFLAYDIWLEVEVRVAENRGLRRDLAEHPTRQRDLTRFWAEWVRLEAAYLGAERGWDRADLLVDGDPSTEHEPEREYVRLP